MVISNYIESIKYLRLFLPSVCFIYKNIFWLEWLPNNEACRLYRSGTWSHIALPGNIEFCANVEEILRRNGNVFVYNMDVFQKYIGRSYLCTRLRKDRRWQTSHDTHNDIRQCTLSANNTNFVIVLETNRYLHRMF